MFDIGWSEIFVIAVLAIIVIGPKDLPKVMRAAGRFVRKARLMANEFREGLEQMAHEVELDEVKKSIHHVSNFNPKTAVQNTLDPTGTFLEPPVLPDEEPAPKKRARPRAKPQTAPKSPRPRQKKAPAPSASDKTGPKT